MNVYNQREEQKKQLDAAEMELMNCSPLEHPQQWSILLGKVEITAIKLEEISNELKKLERKFILYFNNFYLLFFIDIHVDVLGGNLPY